MPRQITISLIKIMNWSHTQSDAKLEISFMHAHNKTYIAHKSIIGQYIDNTILLNTSFKILYQENQQKLICKLQLLKQHRIKQTVGEAELDLQAFLSRKIQYITFSDKDKIIEIHRVDDPSEEFTYSNHFQNQLRDQSNQQNFLNQRYQFLDKVTLKEIQLKKDFSQKVYNLLKDIKYARAAEGLRKQFQDKKSANDFKYDTPQRSQRQNDDKVDKIRKIEAKINENILKNAHGKPPSTKPYKLMIDSIQAYGKKQPATKQYNIYSRIDHHTVVDQEEDYQPPMPVKKNSKQGKIGRKV